MNFIQKVEGKKVANSMDIFFCITRYNAFIEFGKHQMKWVPHTIGNKAKVLSQVTNYFIKSTVSCFPQNNKRIQEALTRYRNLSSAFKDIQEQNENCSA